MEPVVEGTRDSWSINESACVSVELRKVYRNARFMRGCEWDARFSLRSWGRGMSDTIW